MRRWRLPGFDAGGGSDAPVLSTKELRARLDAVPRLPLAELPSPLEPLPRLSARLGRPIYLKRDDALGPALGGNKTRKLEYLLADAKARGARKVVTFGGLQSNHARLTAAAALGVGLEPHLFYFERRPRLLEGNLLLGALLGARLHFVPFGGGGDGGMTIERASRLVHLVAWLRLGPHYFIPVGGHNVLGALGYVRAALELHEQAKALGLGRARVVVASGTGGTLAGLWAGLSLLDSPLEVLGLDIGKLWRAFPRSVAHLAEGLCARLGVHRPFAARDAPLLEREFVGPGYARLHAPALTAMAELLRTEGVVLDPVYTGKAFAGLLALLASGRLGGEEPVIFVHTGGLPALYALSGSELPAGWGGSCES